MWLCKDTNLKANHNRLAVILLEVDSVCDSAKILIWKQITTGALDWSDEQKCMWLCKDTNLKANHNARRSEGTASGSVCDSAKILIWKQITTPATLFSFLFQCMWLCKDTNLKANHNRNPARPPPHRSVCDSAKILIWKQITTSSILTHISHECMWLCKDTNLKANHNVGGSLDYYQRSVCDSAKILIWKQITTCI